MTSRVHSRKTRHGPRPPCPGTLGSSAAQTLDDRNSTNPGPFDPRPSDQGLTQVGHVDPRVHPHPVLGTLDSGFLPPTRPKAESSRGEGFRGSTDVHRLGEVGEDDAHEDGDLRAPGRQDQATGPVHGRAGDGPTQGHPVQGFAPDVGRGGPSGTHEPTPPANGVDRPSEAGTTHLPRHCERSTGTLSPGS